MFDVKPYQFLQYESGSFCCGDYVQLILKDHLGVVLPPVKFNGDPIAAASRIKNIPYRNLFKQIPEPKDFCVVEMSLYRHADHVGVCVQIAGKFYITHCEINRGVLVSTFEAIKQNYEIVGFYEYVG